MPIKGFRKVRAECSIEGCSEPVKARGWCSTHYACWRRTDDPVPRVRPTYGSKRRVTDAGYVQIWEPTHPLAMKDGYVLEHRKVAWDSGLFDDPALHIHHRDEDRLNNDPANLVAKTNPDHAREHIHDRGTVRNQYGEWPVKANHGPVLCVSSG